MSELRWHPFLETWVIVATHRQERPVLPPPEYCPLCPTKPGAFPTEVPAPDYEIVVFENKYPSLHLSPPPPTIAGTPLVPVAPAAGVCEVVLYSPDHHGTLAGTGAAHVRNLIEVWADRFDELGRRPEVEYVFIFENRGAAVGVTLHHPHGQIYAYPFVPPVVKQRLEAARRHFDRHGRCLLCDIIEEEAAADRRIVFENDTAVAYVPSFAQFPYEVHVAPKAHREAITDLTDGERRHLAETMTAVLSKYDGLWGFPMPYVMAQHQRPTDGGRYDYCHFQIEFYPVHRTETKLKHLAGSEVGVGTFIVDDTAEAFAARLQAVAVADGGRSR